MKPVIDKAAVRVAVSEIAEACQCATVPEDKIRCFAQWLESKKTFSINEIIEGEISQDEIRTAWGEFTQEHLAASQGVRVDNVDHASLVFDHTRVRADRRKEARQ